MRKSIYFTLILSAIVLSSCGDLVLFSQKIDGRDPISLEGRYILEIEMDDELYIDTLTFHRVLPYQFIAYSALVKNDTTEEEAGDKPRTGEIFQGEIHQKGDDFFIHKKDEETGKWKIGAFRIRNGRSSHLFETLYMDEYQEPLVNMVKAGKLKVVKESERIYKREDGSEESKNKVYEVSANANKITRIWRKIIRKAPRLVIRKIDGGQEDDTSKEVIVPNESRAMLYPNPSSGLINLALHTTQYWTAELYDLSGKQLKKVSFEGSAYSWDLSDMAAGTYLVKVANKEGNEGKTFKMVKK